MPADLLDAVLQQKGNHDFGSSNLTQHIALEAVTTGATPRTCTCCGTPTAPERDAVLASLQRHMPAVPGLHWTRPEGGLYVWLTLPAGADTSRAGAMFRDAVESGVLYVPGDYCMQADESGRAPTNCLRLSFGQVDAARIEPGIRRLASVVSRHLADKAAATRVGEESKASPKSPI